MRRRLFWSLLGTAAATLLIVAVVFGAVGSAVVSGQNRAQLQSQASRIAGVIEEAIAESDVTRPEQLRGLVAPDAPPDVRRIVDQSGRIAGEAVEVTLAMLTPARRLISSNVPPPVLGVLDIDELAAGRVVTDSVRQDDFQLQVVAHPIAIDDASLLVILTSRSELFDFTEVLRALILPLLVAAVIAGFVASFIARSISSRLSGLASAARMVATGEISTRAPIEGSDEITDVSRAFNDMADDLEDARRREKEFLLQVGHDLRTPLTTIAGYAEVLEDSELDQIETARISKVLAHETGHLRRLVEDLMTLARLETRNFELSIEQVDVVAHLKQTAEAFRMRADSANVRLEVVDDGSGVILDADADRLNQIVGNLIENALRYTPEAGTVTVLLGADTVGLRVTVSDTGPGIDPGDLPHVFDKMYVARRYRRIRPEGSGLGLSIVRELVEAMGGTSNVESDSSGTAVTIEIPG